MSKLYKSIAAASAMFFMATTTFAATTDTLSPPPGSLNPNVDPTSIPQLLINMLFIIAAFLAVAYLMFGGIKWITSRGDKVAVESARKHIVAAIIGLVVVAGSFFILQVVFTILGADNPLKSGFKLPTVSPGT